MRFKTLWAVAGAAVLAAGCGHTAGPSPAPRPVVQQRGTPHCQVAPGGGRMGICAPRPSPFAQSAPFTAQGEPGADVSNYQRCVNPQGLAFIYVKTGEGNNFTDPSGACTIGNALRLHIPVGAYFFARDNGSARFQADRFASLLYGSNLPPDLDFETNDGGLSSGAQCQWIRDFGAEVRARTGRPLTATYDATGLWPGCSSVPLSIAWVASLGNNCGGRLSGFADGGMTICQYTFTGPFGGDGDLWHRGSPRDYLPPPPIPADVVALKNQIVYFWDLRARQPLSAGERQTLDSDMNRIYWRGWQPHRSAPSHDWTLTPGPRERWIGQEVRKHWARNRHGAYVQSLLKEDWDRSHTRVHSYGDVRMRGDYKVDWRGA